MTVAWVIDQVPSLRICEFSSLESNFRIIYPIINRIIRYLILWAAKCLLSFCFVSGIHVSTVFECELCIASCTSRSSFNSSNGTCSTFLCVRTGSAKNPQSKIKRLKRWFLNRNTGTLMNENC